MFTLGIAIWVYAGIDASGITLVYPATGDYIWNMSNPLDFNCSYSTATVFATNVSLWINDTGTWHLNKTYAPGGNLGTGTIYNLTLQALGDGDYVWNCEFNLSDGGGSNMSTTNYTVFVDQTAPIAFSLSNVTISDGTVSGDNTITSDRDPTFNWSATTEAHFINYTLQIANLTIFTAASLEYEKEILGGVTNTSLNLSLEGTNLLPADKVLYWRVIAYENDSANRNPTYSSQNYTFTTDNSMQTITIMSPANNSWVSGGTLNVTYNATDNQIKDCTLYYNVTGSGFIRNLTQADVTQYNYNNITLALSDNNYTFYVECNDTQSNWGNSSQYNVRMDNTNPVVDLNLWGTVGSTLTAHNANNNNSNYTSRTVYFGFNTVENNSVTCILYHNDSGTFAANQTVGNSSTGYSINTDVNFTLPIIFAADGSYLYNVWCNDSAGNSAYNATNMTINVDATVPSIAMTSPANNLWSAAGDSNIVRFNYTVTDTFIKNCTIYGNFSGTWKANATNVSLTSGTESVTNVSIPEGTNYKWNVLCYDYGGRSNWSSATNYTLNVDTTAPTRPNLGNVLIGSTVNGNNTLGNTLLPIVNWTIVTETNFANYTIQFSNETGFSNINYSEKITPITTNTTTVTATNLADNVQYYWRVIAYDDAGNSNTSDPYYWYKADTIDPIVAINLPSPSITQIGYDTDGAVVINYTITDNNPSNCTLYGNFSGDWQANETNSSVDSTNWDELTTLNLENGTYIWNIKCMDNVITPHTTWNLSTSNFTLIVDSEKPTIDVSSINNTVTTDRQITFTVTDVGNALVNLSTISIISWNTSETTNFNNATDCTSSDGNQSFICTYTETALLGGTNYLNVSAKDMASTSSDATTLYITTSGANNFTVSLSSGWNLISTPLILTDSSIDAVVANNSAIDTIYWYDNSGSTYNVWYNDSSYTDTLTTIEPRKGYWINATAATTLNLFGDYYTSGSPSAYDGLSLAAGWHTIGHYKTTAADGFNTSQVLGNLVTSGYYDFSSLWYWDASSQAPQDATQSRDVIASAGYAIDGVWNRGRAFWIYRATSGNQYQGG